MTAGERRRTRAGTFGLLPTTLIVALCLAVPSASGAAAERFVYVSNGFTGVSQNVTAYRIGANGALVQLGGSPYATGATTQEGLAVTPDGAHLYVASNGTNQVMKFNVQADGGLAGLQALNPGGTTFTAPLGVVPSPDGNVLFTWNHGNSIPVTTINANGTLTNIPGSPFTIAAGFTNPFAGSVSPDGNHLYVPFENTDPGGGAPDRSGVFSVAANGALANTQTVVTGGGAGADGNPFGSGITPDGRFVYISAPEDQASVGDVYGFSRNLTTGALTAIPGSPFNVTPGLGHPLTIAAAPDGLRLYVAIRAADAVKAYNINQTTGALTSIGNFATGGTNGKSLAFTPDGKRLYVANQLSDNISGFNVNANGSLSLLQGSPYPTGDSPDLESIVISPNQGPTASFTTTPGFAGQPTGFNATGSSDDGDIVNYNWDFGDGTTLPDGGPIPNHIYATPGTFNAKVTVTDDEGCSTQRIFTGKAMLCNATAAATQTVPVNITTAPAPPAPSNFARQLTIKFNKKKKLFKGQITSTETACVDDEKVTVFRKKGNKKVGSVQSGADGTWKLKDKNADGKYFAVVDQTRLPDDDTCLAVQSANAKVG